MFVNDDHKSEKEPAVTEDVRLWKERYEKFYARVS
jgi:hypothetical protein